MMRWFPLIAALLLATCAAQTTPVLRVEPPQQHLIALGEGTTITLPLEVDDWLEVVCVEVFSLRKDQQRYGCLTAEQLRQMVERTLKAN